MSKKKAPRTRSELGKSRRHATHRINPAGTKMIRKFSVKSPHLSTDQNTQVAVAAHHAQARNYGWL